VCCIPRPDALMRQDRKDKDANASDVEELVIPVATATDTTDTPPSETMSSAVTCVASVSEPAIQVVEEVVEA